MKARWAAAALLLLLAAGCEPSVPACPGDAQGTFDVVGVAREPGTTCAFSLAAIAEARAGGTPPSIGFTATVAWEGPAEAALCVQRPMADARVGPRSGDGFTVTFTLPQAALASCPCAVDVQETLAATLLRSGGRATGLAGTLVDRYTRSASAAACYAAADPAALAAGCPGAPDSGATPPSDGGCDAAWDLSTAAP